MNIHQQPINPYQTHGAHPFDHTQHLQQAPFGQVPQPQYFRPPQQALSHTRPPAASFAPPTAPNFINAPPNTQPYPHFAPQFNAVLPVHNGIPIQHQAPPRQHRAPQIPAPVQRVEQITAESSQSSSKPDKHLKGLKCIPEPPDKELWRQKLFDVEGLMILTEEEFQVYFPHVDNVYSHRSTQDYKRKPFISHYYDCRLKGRPAGTPKSSDPNKKKRKRVARERDLCDVKIKITEYQEHATAEDIAAHLNQQPGRDGAMSAEEMLARGQGVMPWAMQGQETKKFYTVQRVNGTGANSGIADGDGRHKHTLEESDRIKKNSVVRSLQPAVKERDKRPKPPEKKSYHTKATGAALATVKKHSKDHTLKLYGSCFCPFVQRVWISLEYKQIPYQYIEIDPYKKPDWYLKLNPRGLVPTLQDGDWTCYESTVLMEYLEDIGQGPSLLPMDPKKKAYSRLWSDHINRKIVPAFYHYLQAQEQEKQVENAKVLKEEIGKLVDVADAEGPFFLGSEMGFVDVQMAPWVVRLQKVLKPYRGWPDPDPQSRWGKWVAAIEANDFVTATMSGDELYLDSYERYAENRPGTSQVADAVNSGRGLP